MRHFPGDSSDTTQCSGQGHEVSSRTGTRFILHSGHVPGRSSTISGCIGQVIDSGGSTTVVDRARCAISAAFISTTAIAASTTAHVGPTDERPRVDVIETYYRWLEIEQESGIRNQESEVRSQEAEAGRRNQG